MKLHTSRPYLIENVEAEVCQQCGERYDHARILDKLDALIQNDHQSVFLPAGDRAGIERLVGYMTHWPFSLSRLVKVTASGQVVYEAEKDARRAFPDPQGHALARGGAPGTPGRRNFPVLWCG